MTKQQEILKKIVILLYQLGESIENGDHEMGYVRTATGDIDKLIEEL